MKTLLSRVLVVVTCLTILLCMNIDAAAQTFAFTAVQDTANGTSGGYWATDGVTQISASDNNGITLLNPNVDQRVIWAFENTTITDVMPYLHYELPEGQDSIYKITICYNFNVEQELELDVTSGKHVVDIKKMFTDNNQITNGYTYVALYVRGGVAGSVNNLFFSSSAEVEAAPAPDDNTGTPDTGDGIVAAVVAVAAAAACVVVSRKHR